MGRRLREIPVIDIETPRLHAIRGFGHTSCGIYYGDGQVGQFRYADQVKRTRICRNCLRAEGHLRRQHG